MIRYERLSKENFNDASLDGFIRTQNVKRVYRKCRSQYVLVNLPYVEDWTIE